MQLYKTPSKTTMQLKSNKTTFMTTPQQKLATHQHKVHPDDQTIMYSGTHNMQYLQDSTQQEQTNYSKGQTSI